MAKKKSGDEKVVESAFDKKMAELNTKYGGKESIITRGFEYKHVETVSTGSILFDIATACGGYPRGKLIEIFGAESSSKSTMCLHAISNFQKVGKVALIDAEHAFDVDYARAIGVNVDDLYVAKPETMEDAYNMSAELMQTNEFSLIVIDSHTALEPKALFDHDIGEGNTVGAQARVNSNSLRKLKPLIEKHNCTLIGVAQTREDIGAMFGGAKSSGGNAWKFYPDMRIKTFKKQDTDNGGILANIEIFKNKLGRPLNKAEIPISWGVGINKHEEVLNTCMLAGTIKRAGAWYTDVGTGTSLGQGKVAVIELFKDNEEYYQLKRKEAETWAKQQMSS